MDNFKDCGDHKPIGEKIFNTSHGPQGWRICDGCWDKSYFQGDELSERKYNVAL